jgi:hypothetical protein
MTLYEKVRHNLNWLPAFLCQRLTRYSPNSGSVHLIIALADHFEPSFVPEVPETFAPREERERRVDAWCREYPSVVEGWPDSDGRLFRHTYFYPAEQYEKALIGRLVEHCNAGWGEIEIHLHHGMQTPDTSENTQRQLLKFRDELVGHGCLSRIGGNGPPRYAFVHGNWALANSAGGRDCGVDDEMQILAETGCYADFTLPSAPHPAQIAKINALYECALPLDHRAPHRRGRDLERWNSPQVFPLMIQGPLMLDFSSCQWVRVRPRIENGELTAVHPPTMHRLRLWRAAGIVVRGRPEWVFIKLHCHGMDPRDRTTLLGVPMRTFLRELAEGARSGAYYTHFVTAREMTNIVLAACDGQEGNPGDYRDYRLLLVNQPANSIKSDIGRCKQG